MGGFDQKLVEDILGFDFHEAGGRPVAATIVFFGDHASVENDLDPLTFIKQDAEDRRRSDRGAEHAFEQRYWREGDAGAAELLGESLPSEALVARGDEEVEVFFALIAKKEGLDHLHPQFRIDGGAVLHCHGDVGVRPLEGNLPFREFLVDKSLEFCRRLDWSLIGYRTDIKHDVILVSPEVYHPGDDNKNEC